LKAVKIAGRIVDVSFEHLGQMANSPHPRWIVRSIDQRTLSRGANDLRLLTPDDSVTDRPLSRDTRDPKREAS
jgi:hypothetical protein